MPETHRTHNPSDIYGSGSFEARFPKLARGDSSEPTEDRKEKAIERMDVAGESQYEALRQEFGMARDVPDHLEKDTDEPKKYWKEGEEKEGGAPLYNTMNPYAPDATVIGEEKKEEEVKDRDLSGKADNSASLTTDA